MIDPTVVGDGATALASGPERRRQDAGNAAGSGTTAQRKGARRDDGRFDRELKWAEVGGGATGEGRFGSILALPEPEASQTLQATSINQRAIPQLGTAESADRWSMDAGIPIRPWRTISEDGKWWS